MEMPGATPVVEFIPAFCNRYGYTVYLYYGVQTPITFLPQKPEKKKKYIYLQWLSGTHFNLLKPCPDFLPEAGAQCEY
jgi:hypothetical protein